MNRPVSALRFAQRRETSDLGGETLKQPSYGVYKPTRERLAKARKRINEWRKSLPDVDDSEYMAHEIELYRAFEDLRERANSVIE